MLRSVLQMIIIHICKYEYEIHIHSAALKSCTFFTRLFYALSIGWMFLPFSMAFENILPVTPLYAVGTFGRMLLQAPTALCLYTVGS